MSLADPHDGRSRLAVVLGGAGVLVLALVGVPALSDLPLLIVLACPLMMFVMMRGMGMQQP